MGTPRGGRGWRVRQEVHAQTSRAPLGCAAQPGHRVDLLRAGKTVRKTHERLSALDAAFLQVEDDSAHMRGGGTIIFDGEPRSYDELATSIASRLHRLPRYRQRLAWPPGGVLRPCWVDDPRFDVRFHVRHAALPHPRGEAELRELAGLL